MKNYFSKILFFISFLSYCFSNSLNFLGEESSYAYTNPYSPNTGIQPGIGYSSDTNSIAKAVCYKNETLIQSGQSSVLKFDEALDFSTLAKSFNVEVDLKG